MSDTNENKELFAAGISYKEEDKAPVISSLGEGEKAHAIVKMAKELGIYIHEDPLLADELSRLQEGEQIPKELFEVIAVIMSFSYILQGKTPDIYKRNDGSTAVNIDA